MDKLIEQILKSFSHIAREIQLYFLSGLIIFINIICLDYFYYDSSLRLFLNQNNVLIPTIFIIYIAGHFCMAFYFILLEYKHNDDKIAQWMGLNVEKNETLLPSLFQKNPVSYFHFVERYVVVSLMRWLISSACTICFLVNLIYICKEVIIWQIVLVTFIYLVGACLFFILYIQSEKEYWDRVNSM